MAKTIWDDQEPFRDGAPDYAGAGKWEEPQTYTPAPDTAIRAAKIKEAQALAAQAQEEYDVEDLTDQVFEESEEEDYTEVLSDARLRLEQGKLYEMIMNHDLFSGVESDPRAAKSVQKQIRKFAKEQMEVMLGMRQAYTAVQEFVSPFNGLEIEVLKKLASAATKGATESEEAEEMVSAPVPQPKKKTLNAIGMPKPRQQPKPIQKKTAPIERKAAPQRQLPPEFEEDYKPIGKPVHELTAAELAERDRQALERQKGRKSAVPADRAPPADYAVQEMLALQQVSRAVGTPTKGNLSAMIMANLKNAGKM